MSWKKWKSTITGAGAGALAGFATGGIAGAVIGAGAGGYLGYSTDAQNRANQKAVDRANAYDLYTWDLANKYNDPKAQMQRLAAAGLNPNLVYGSGSVTGNTTGTAGSNGVASQEAFNVIQKGLPLAQGLANLRNTNTQNELLKYQQGQTQAQTAEIQAQTAMMPYRQAYTQAQTDVMRWNLEYAKEHGLPVGSMPGLEATLAGGINWLANRQGYYRSPKSQVRPFSWLSDFNVNFERDFGGYYDVR